MRFRIQNVYKLISLTLAISVLSGNTRVSAMRTLFNLLEDKKTTRQTLIHTLVRTVADCEDEKLGRFIVLSLGSLEYAYQEDVLHVIYCLNDILSFNAASLLQNMSEDKIKKSLIKQTVTATYVVRLKQFLKSFYSISANRCEAYSVTDTKRTPLNTKVPISLINLVSTSKLDMGMDLTDKWYNDEEKCKAQYKLVY